MDAYHFRNWRLYHVQREHFHGNVGGLAVPRWLGNGDALPCHQLGVCGPAAVEVQRPRVGVLCIYEILLHGTSV